MNIAEAKILIETEFMNNWKETFIQWHGIDFDISNLNEWVQLSISPSRTKLSCQNNKNASIDFFIDLTIYSREELRNYILFDMINDFFLGIQFKDCFCNDIQIDTKAKMTTSNGDYELLETTIFLKSLYL